LLWDRLRYVIMYFVRLSKKQYDITRHSEDNFMLRTTTGTVTDSTVKRNFEIRPRGIYRNGRIHSHSLS
jgi:hypothetical protein